MATMNISLPDQMKEWIEARVATGRYANVSDFVRDMVRERQERHDKAMDWLEAEIRKGIDSGPAVEMDWEKMKKRIEARFEAEGIDLNR